MTQETDLPPVAGWVPHLQTGWELTSRQVGQTSLSAGWEDPRPKTSQIGHRLTASRVDSPPDMLRDSLPERLSDSPLERLGRLTPREVGLTHPWRG